MPRVQFAPSLTQHTLGAAVNAPAKCEVDWINDSQDILRTYRQVDRQTDIQTFLALQLDHFAVVVKVHGCM